jgi:hypothetical protein
LQILEAPMLGGLEVKLTGRKKSSFKSTRQDTLSM